MNLKTTKLNQLAKYNEIQRFKKTVKSEKNFKFIQIFKSSFYLSIQVPFIKTLGSSPIMRKNFKWIRCSVWSGPIWPEFERVVNLPPEISTSSNVRDKNKYPTTGICLKWTMYYSLIEQTKLAILLLGRRVGFFLHTALG